jgi:hypothetical protein
MPSLTIPSTSVSQNPDSNTGNASNTFSGLNAATQLLAQVAPSQSNPLPADPFADPVPPYKGDKLTEYEGFPILDRKTFTQRLFDLNQEIAKLAELPLKDRNLSAKEIGDKLTYLTPTQIVDQSTSTAVTSTNLITVLQNTITNFNNSVDIFNLPKELKRNVPDVTR